jgi:GT2 family glycosyltransferase
MSVAIAVPSLNQGRFLGAALDSIRADGRTVHVAVLDAGSRDESRAIIEARAPTLAFWRSEPDAGQAAAINEGVARLIADRPEVDAVGWLNADDVFLPDGLDRLARALDAHPDWAAVSARGVLVTEDGRLAEEIETSPFDPARFALACTICQPATLVRRRAWERVGGLDASLDMCFDYDLWWRLSKVGPIGYFPEQVAGSRDHGETKTRTRRARYFAEATAIVRRETGHVPWHWYISEALEREVGYEVGRRPATFGRLTAGARALVDFTLGRGGRPRSSDE